MVFVRDITEQRRTEEALRKSEENFSKAFDAKPTITSIANQQQGDRFIEVNDAFQQSLRHNREEVIGRNSEELGLLGRSWSVKRKLEKRKRLANPS